MKEWTLKQVELLSPAQEASFNSRYEDKKKDPTTALLLCLILGGIGAHEFYLNNVNKGVIYLVFCWTLIPGLIALIQLFTIQKRVKDENDAIAQKILAGIKDQGPIGSIGAGNVAGVEADLTKLQEMRDSGTISEDEYQQLRKKSLGL